MRRKRVPRRLALAMAVGGALAPLVRRRLRLPRPVTSILVWQAPVALCLAVPRSRTRDAAVYGLQMWAYVTHYELPNDIPERLADRVRVRYPITVDRILGAGEIPTIRLQQALGRPGRVLPHDTVLSVIHWSWFFFPHGVVAYILLRHRDHFERSAVQVAAVFDFGALVYFVVPTAPPWWAAEHGHLPRVRRIMTEAGARFWRRAWGPLYDSLSGNQLAAMPSLHFGTSVMAAHVLSDIGRKQGALGWTYALSLGFALVYLGEHYVIDLVAGLGVAEAVRLARPVAAPPLLAFRRAIGELEPGGGR